MIKKKISYKIQALSIFMSVVLGSFLNIIIQNLNLKQRPELSIINKDQLILSHLPTDPFPSDHATVSAAITTATLLIAFQINNTFLKGIGYLFVLASLIMGIARVGVAIHRPTDVLLGWCIGIFT